MSRREPAILLVAVIVLLALSRIGALEPGTWLLEIAPILIIAPVLVLTARRFPLTPLVYRLLFVHALILMLGGHYTIREGAARLLGAGCVRSGAKPLRRVGHLAQGFIPAMLAREVLLRRSPLTRGKWLGFLVVCVCLAFSATYELIEWLAAVLGGSAADAFLGTQGDAWDTQWDMFMALIGATSALLLAVPRARPPARAPRSAAIAASSLPRVVSLHPRSQSHSFWLRRRSPCAGDPAVADLNRSARLRMPAANPKIGIVLA
jgi:putative membrane protein